MAKVGVKNSRATLNRKLKDIKSSHFDGMFNVVTGIGTNRDKRMASEFRFDPKTPDFFEELYVADELAARIVNLVPDEALRKWVEWTKVDKEIAVEVEKVCQDLDLKNTIERAWKWARVFGGACLYMVTDTDYPDQPLQAGEKVIGLRDLSRYDLRIMSTDVESDFASSNFGKPRIYYLVVQIGTEFKGYPIHWTRMVRFDGQLVPRRTYIRNNYWHESVLNKLHNSIRNYQSSNDATATLLQDFNINIYKMKNLAQLVAAGREDVVKQRMELLNFSKSTINAIILDSDDEDYIDISRSVAGLPELLTQQANRLVAATDIPHTKLLGESPDGSNATGNSTTSQWFDFIQSEQENYLRPKLRQLLDIIFYNIPELDFKFKSLTQLSELEEADLRLKQSQVDSAYVSAGVLDPNEVAMSRFGGDEYSTETTLDIETRNAQGDPSQEGMSDIDQLASQATPRIEQLANQATPRINQLASQAKPRIEQLAAQKPAGKPDDNFKTDGEFETNYDLNQINAYTLNNSIVESSPKEEAIVSQTMSEPMRDPHEGDPRIRQGGTPNNPRYIEPTIGDGIVAESGILNNSKYQKKS